MLLEERARLLAVDPSLTCSGWALFSIKGGGVLGVGKIMPRDKSGPPARRLADVQLAIAKLYEQLSLGVDDVVVCEAPTTMRDPRSAFLVEQVRGIFETLARGCQALVPGRLNPRSVQYEVLGLRGSQLNRAYVKAAGVTVAGQLYGNALAELGFDIDSEQLKKHQDIVDALLVGSLALSRVRSADRAGSSLDELFDDGFQRRRGRRRLQALAGGENA